MAVACGRVQWQDVNPAWTEGMLHSWRAGCRKQLFIDRSVLDDKTIQEAYTVHMSDHTLIMQQKEGNRARCAMRVLQLKQPRLVHLKNIPESLHNDCGLRFQ